MRRLSTVLPSYDAGLWVRLWLECGLCAAALVCLSIALAELAHRLLDALLGFFEGGPRLWISIGIYGLD
jgi:hypothetical protein